MPLCCSEVFFPSKIKTDEAHLTTRKTGNDKAGLEIFYVSFNDLMIS